MAKPKPKPMSPANRRGMATAKKAMRSEPTGFVSEIGTGLTSVRKTKVTQQPATSHNFEQMRANMKAAAPKRRRNAGL